MSLQTMMAMVSIFREIRAAASTPLFSAGEDTSQQKMAGRKLSQGKLFAGAQLN